METGHCGDLGLPVPPLVDREHKVGPGHVRTRLPPMVARLVPETAPCPNLATPKTALVSDFFFNLCNIFCCFLNSYHKFLECHYIHILLPLEIQCKNYS